MKTIGRVVLVLAGLCIIVGGQGLSSVRREVSVAAAERNEPDDAVVSVSSLSLTSTYSYTVMLPVVFTPVIPPPQSSFGVQMYGTLTESRVAFSLARLGQVYWVRWPVSWSSVEYQNVTPDQYTWSSLDANVLNATRSGHEVIATIISNPSWAATYPQGPIDKVPISEFADFVHALVERYDGDGVDDAPGSPVVRNFEFYNEPDSINRPAAEQGYGGYWGDYGSDYAAMLCAASAALKSASQDAKVVFGGIAYDSFITEGGSFNQAFLGDVLAADLSEDVGDCFDVMNFHYYPNADPRWYAYGNGLEGKASHIREQLAAYGVFNKPMVVTEAGWHSDYYNDANPGSHQIQSQYVVKLFAQAAAADLDSLIWFSWIDPGLPCGDNGLLTQQLETKPSFGVYTYAARTLGQATFNRIYPTAAGIEGYQFTSASQSRLYVFWAQDGQTHGQSVPGSQVHLVSMYGDTIGYVDDGGDGTVWFSVGADPVYVEVVH